MSEKKKSIGDVLVVWVCRTRDWHWASHLSIVADEVPLVVEKVCNVGDAGGWSRVVSWRANKPGHARGTLKFTHPFKRGTFFPSYSTT